MKRAFEKKLNEGIDLTDKVCDKLNLIESCYYQDDVYELADQIRIRIMPNRTAYVSILDQLKEVDTVENLGECMDIINKNIESLKRTLEILS